MKTPWRSLMQYGVGLAAMLVIILGGLIMLTVVGIAVVLAKLAVFMK